MYEEYYRVLFPNSNVNINITKWDQLYDLLSGTRHITYIVFDQIDELKTFALYKKNLLKLIALSKLKNLRIIFVSNFDIIKSEMRTLFDFSTFISLCFPFRSKRDIKNAIDKVLMPQYFVNNKECKKYYNDIINKSIANFDYIFINMNEYIYCVKENIENYCKNAHIDEERALTISTSESSDNHHVIRNNYINSKFVVHNELDKEEFTKVLQRQVNVAPIHIKKYYIFSEGIEDKSNILLFNTGKNINDNISHVQKILILSAFIASETNPNYNEKLFRNNKRTFIPYKKKPCGVRGKYSYPFDISQLIAIYWEIKHIIEGWVEFEEEEVNIELICEVETLVDLKQIRPLGENWNIVMTRKFVSLVTVDLALKISEDFEIELDDFVHYEIEF